MTTSESADQDPNPLDVGEIMRLVDAALAAVGAATTTAELKQVRIDHAGDKSPLALANRAIGKLEPGQRKHVGHAVGNDGVVLRCPSNFVFQRAVPMPPGVAQADAC